MSAAQMPGLKIKLQSVSSLLVSLHLLVNILSPGFHTTFQVNDITKTNMFQVITHLATTNTMMANHHGFSILIQIIHMIFDLAHRYQDRTINLAIIKFPWFTHIQQQG